MKPAGVLLAIGGVTLIAGLNLISMAQSGVGVDLADAQAAAPSAASAGSASGLPRVSWELLQSTVATPSVQGGQEGFSLAYPPELEALAGERVRIEGAGFHLRKGEGPIERFALTPASLKGCCGPACTPSLNGVALIHCGEQPIPRALWPAGGRIVAVEGVLRLGHPSDLGCAFGLSDASVRLLDPASEVVVFDSAAQRGASQ